MLGSATTMALPPAAAVELLHACSAQIDEGTASREECQAALRSLLSDYAMCWQLLGSDCKQEELQFADPAEGNALTNNAAVAEGAGAGLTEEAAAAAAEAELAEQALGSLLHHLVACNMPNCLALLWARNGAAGDADSEEAAGEEAQVLAAPSGSLMAGAADPTTSVPAQLAAPGSSRIGLLVKGICSTQVAAAAVAVAAAAAASGATRVNAGVSILATVVVGRGQAWIPGSWAAAAADPGFPAWKQKQRGRLDWAGAVVVTAVHGGTLLVLLGRSRAQLLNNAGLACYALLHALISVVPRIVLAQGGSTGRPDGCNRRGAVVLAQVSLRAVAFLASAMCFLPLPLHVGLVLSRAVTKVVTQGLLQPVFYQVSARVREGERGWRCL